MSKTITNAIRIHETGAANVMKLEQVELGEPGPGEVLLRQHAIGVNYIDVYFRSGIYKQPMPGGIGMEGAGIIEKIGPDVTLFKVGDRVAYAGGPTGSYSEARIMPAKVLVHLPKELSFEQGAAMMLQGMTVQYLVKDVYHIKKGDTVLFHAAAGGVGLIASQWIKALGGHMIGTVGTPEKAKLAESLGCDHTILYTKEDFVARVKEITNGVGVAATYDSVGKDTFMKSMDCLAPRGMLVTYGASSGPIEPLDLSILGGKGSLRVCRPTIATYVQDRKLLEPMANDLFQMVISGQIKLQINHKYSLKDAAQAHIDLEGRNTTGSSILLP
jgi:NADPH2:quinone reductase